MRWPWCTNFPFGGKLAPFPSSPSNFCETFGRATSLLGLYPRATIHCCAINMVAAEHDFPILGANMLHFPLPHPLNLWETCGGIISIWDLYHSCKISSLCDNWSGHGTELSPMAYSIQFLKLQSQMLLTYCTRFHLNLLA